MAFACLFPGQGSQSIGMMDSLTAFPIVQETFQEASDVLGIDLWAMLARDDKAIHDTINTQPLMLTAGIATWRAWKKIGGSEPALVAGHSLGEYSALVAAEVMAFSDALVLVRLRAQYMQEAVPQSTGAMAAILGLAEQIVVKICHEASSQGCVEVANFNTPEQIVIAGETRAVEYAMQIAKEKGAKRALRLPVSVPSHCTLMQVAAEKLTDTLNNLPLKPPRIAVLHNVDAQQHVSVQAIRHTLLTQLYQPVQWTKTIQTIVKQGVQHFVECGPGKVLTGLIRRIDPQLNGIALIDEATLLSAQATLK
ncbi:MAG: ACP S-malonyltransferase [Neisseriales bacterium]|nr:MAG: ACP S-malonyltransferase [Neisseriales bacterium]